MASRLQEFIDFTEELLKANRRAYHDHDNLLPSHPVRVKDHPNWFSRVENLSNEQKIQQTIKGDINLYKTLSVLSKHGTPYLVGGSVRDIILGKESKDYDIEVYGISSEKLGQILEAELGAKPQQVGKQFGVFKFGDFDISLPRKEIKTGERHTDFDVEFDENLEPRDGARRRDFTVNALMYSPKTGKIYDFFGGLDDLKNKQLKHIDDKTFVEDALRVYRAAQFAGRFGFTIHPATKQLAASIDLSHLPPERLYEEFKKLFLKSPKPSVGIRALDDMGVLDKYFPEIAALKTTDQRSDYHAEGDVYIHTNMVIDKAAEIIKNFRSEQDQKTIMLAAFAHDFGKPSTTKHSSDGLITQHGHEEAGVEPTKVFLSKLTTETDTIADVSFLVEHHLLPMSSHRNELSDAGFRKMINKYGIDRLKLLSAVSRADVTGRLHTNKDGTIGEPGTEAIDWFEGKIKEISGNLGTTAEGKITPLLTGNDLIGAGFKEGPDLGKVLGAVRSQQEDGSLTNKAEAMKFVSENFVAKSSLEQFKELLKAITPEGVQAMANGLVPQTGNPEAPGKWILPPSMEEPVEEPEAETEKPAEYLTENAPLGEYDAEYYEKYGKEFVTHLLELENGTIKKDSSRYRGVSRYINYRVQELGMKISMGGADLEPFYEALLEQVDKSLLEDNDRNASLQGYGAEKMKARDVYAALSVQIATYSSDSSINKRIINDCIYENGLRLPLPPISVEDGDARNPRIRQLMKLAPISLFEEWVDNIDDVKTAKNALHPKYNKITGKWSNPLLDNPTENTNIPQLIGESGEALDIIEERLIYSTYLTDDIRANFSEKIRNWNSFKEGDKLLPSLEEFPKKLQEIFSESNILYKENPTKELVKVIDELYRSTQFGQFHELSRDGWEESSSSNEAALLKDAASEVLDGPVIFHGSPIKQTAELGEIDTAHKFHTIRDNAYENFTIEEHSLSPNFATQYMGVQKQLTSELLDKAFPDVEDFEVFRGMDDARLYKEIDKPEFGYEDTDSDTPAPEFDSLFENVTGKFEENPISSWSLNYTTASSNFAEGKQKGVVLRKKINKGDVWSSFLTHAYHGNEYEMIVIPNKNHFTVGAVFSGTSSPGLDRGHNEEIPDAYEDLVGYNENEALSNRGLGVSNIFNTESERGGDYRMFLQELEKDSNITKADENKKFQKINIEANGNEDWIKEVRKRLEETKTDDNLSKGITPEGMAARARGLVPQTGNFDAPGRWILPSEREAEVENSSYEMPKYDMSWEALMDSKHSDGKLKFDDVKFIAITDSIRESDHSRWIKENDTVILNTDEGRYYGESEEDVKNQMLQNYISPEGRYTHEYYPPRLTPKPDWATDENNSSPEIPSNIKEIHYDDIPDFYRTNKYGKALQQFDSLKGISRRISEIAGINSEPFYQALRRIDGKLDYEHAADVFSQELDEHVTEKQAKLALNRLQDMTQKSLEHRGLPETFYVFRGGEVYDNDKPMPTSLSPATAADNIFSQKVGEPYVAMYEVNRDDVLLDMNSMKPGAQQEEELIILGRHLKNQRMVRLPNRMIKNPEFHKSKSLEKEITPEGMDAMARGLVPQTGNPETPGNWIRDKARGSTARPWAKTTVGTWVLDNVDKDTKILDYGAGKGFQTRRLQGIEEYAPGGIHAEHAPDKPFTNVHAYDAYSSSNAEHSYNDASLLDNKYGVVMVSNVLNVQETDQDLHETLNELASLIDDGKIVVNFPDSPRKNKESMPAEGRKQQREWLTNTISEHFNSVKPIQVNENDLLNHWELSKPKTKLVEKQEGGVGGAAYAGGTVMGTEQSTSTFGRVDSKKKPKNELFDILSKVTKKSEVNLDTLKVMIGNQQFILEMTTDQVKGLGGRTSLETGHGMIFPFRGWYPAKMTMDDMKFPLDFIIVGKDDNIIQIERNVQPAEGVILTFPPCKMIIEINAGESHTVLLNDIVSGVSFFQNYMVKSVGEAPGASNARAHDLVPQTGSWEHPGRWVRQEEADDKNGNPAASQEHEANKEKGFIDFTDKIQQSIDFDEEEDIASSDIKSIEQKIVSLYARIQVIQEDRSHMERRLSIATFVQDERKIKKILKGIDNLLDKSRSLRFIKNATENLARTLQYKNKREIAEYEFKFDKTGRLASFAQVSDNKEDAETGHRSGTFHIDAAVTIASKYRKENSSSGVQVMMDVLHRFLTESKSDTISCQPLDDHVQRFYKKLGFTELEGNLDFPASDSEEDKEQYELDLQSEGELYLSREKAFDLYNHYSKHFNMSPVLQKEHSGAMEEIRELIELESKFGILVGGKLKKEEVQYRDATEIEKDDGIMCGTCKYFNGEISTCDLVKGTILPSDWCSIFAPIDESSTVEKQEAPGAQDARKEGLVPQSGRWDKPERWVRPEEIEGDDSKVKEDREITSKKKFFGKIAGSYDVDTELQALEDYKDTLPDFPSQYDVDKYEPKKRAINNKIREEWEGIDFIEGVFAELHKQIKIINSVLPAREADRERTSAINMEEYEFKFGEDGGLEAFAKVNEGSKVFSIDTVVTLPSKYKKQGSSAGTKLMMDLMHRFLTESKAELVVATPLNEHVGKYYKKFGFIETDPGVFSTLSMDREAAKVAYNKFSKRFKTDLIKQEQQEDVDHDDLLDDLKELIALEEEVGVLAGNMKKKEEKIEKAEEWSDYHLKDVAKQMLAPDHRLSFETAYPAKTGYKGESDFVRELSEAGKFDEKLITDETLEEQDMNLKEELDTIYQKQEQETTNTAGCSLCEGDCGCVNDLGCECDHDCICSDLEFGKMIIGGY